MCKIGVNLMVKHCKNGGECVKMRHLDNYSKKLEVNVRFGNVNKSVFFDLANVNVSEPLHREEAYLHTKKRNMDKQNITLEQAANYLIDLYSKEYDGYQYRCTLTKIEKLLSIADFVYMKNTKKDLFAEKVCINPCGTGFPKLARIIPSNIGNATYENNGRINAENGETNAIKQLIKDVFIKYGAYESVYLGRELIDVLKNNVKSSSEKEHDRDVIDSNLVFDFFSSLDVTKYDEKVQDFFNYIINYPWIAL